MPPCEKTIIDWMFVHPWMTFFAIGSLFNGVYLYIYKKKKN